MRGQPLLALLCLLGCLVGGELQAAPGDTRRFDVVVTPSADLKRAQVVVRFTALRPRRMFLLDRAALRAVRIAPTSGWSLRGGALLPPAGRGAAPPLVYDVDIEAVAAALGSHRVRRVGRDLLMHPGSLIPRLGRRPGDVGASVRFLCPGGVEVATAWARVARGGQPHHYDLPAEGLLRDGWIAFGRFVPQEVRVPGSTLRLTVLDGELEATTADLRNWLQIAAGAVAPLFGRYPVAQALVLVCPSRPSNEPVIFGRAMRAGGGTNIFYVAANATGQDLPGEWIGVHEMTHLGMPWTEPRDDWFQEGFVTYYQEVLRARAGTQSAEQSWQLLHEGFRRGEQAAGVQTLAEASERMKQEHGYMRVYWGGAIIALLYDIAIRTSMSGRSLDDVMRYWHQRFGARRQRWRAEPLIQSADQWLGNPIGLPIARRVVRSKDFPDLEALYAKLGLVLERGRVRLHPDPDRSRLARAIMAAPAPIGGLAAPSR
jgi:hypothetical protein